MKIRGTTPSPEGPTPGQGATPASAFPSTGGEEYTAASMGAWGQMFHGMASAKEIKQMMDLAIKQMLDEMKKDQQKMIEAIKKMRKDQEDDQS